MPQVRLFAAAAEVLGTEELHSDATTPTQLMVELAEGAGATANAVLSRCSLLVEGRKVDPRIPEQCPDLLEDTVVDVLPPFAGG